ncbi:MAG TPA: MBL fold metallo-hydrolase [Conexibacter sp.]
MSSTRDDADALRGLEAVPLGLPRGLELEWLGVSGYRIAYEGVALFVDPYVSRVPLRSLLLRRTALPDPAQLDRWAGAGGDDVAGVLVGHTHFDHAVDAPAIAQRFRAPAYGSSSLVTLMQLHGLGGLAVAVEPYRRYELGPFVVSFTPSAHSKLILGRRVPFDGELCCDHLHGLSPGAYRCGQVWGIRIEVAGISLYHQGSANLVDAALRDEPVDVFLAGVAGRAVTPRYWARVLPRLDPRVVVPTHYDDFFKPLGARLGFIRKVRLEDVPEEIHAVSRDATVAALPRTDVGAERAPVT